VRHTAAGQVAKQPAEDKRDGAPMKQEAGNRVSPTSRTSTRVQHSSRKSAGFKKENLLILSRRD
jgi:hypothetical protein